MVNNSTNINKKNNHLIGGIVDHHCLTIFRWEVIALFVDIGGIVNHHCLTIFRWEVIVLFVDIGGIVDHQYQQKEQSPLTER
jgi:hypothetical protein